MVDSTNDKPLLVRANDADEGENQRILFKLVDSDDDSNGFIIDSETGAVKRMSGFDVELQEYQLKVGNAVLLLF